MSYQPRFAGAVPLDALAARRPAPAATPAPTDGSAGNISADAAGAPVTVVDVTEATFQTEVVDRSMSVPVVIDFWAGWCGPCKQLSPILERLAAADGGAWVLAKIDVDANQRIAAAAGVQGIPAVKAVWQGGVVGEFTGAMPEAQVRGWLDQLLQATGAGAAGSAAADAEAAQYSQAHLDAAAAFERGDFDVAERGFQELLDNQPSDSVAQAALAGIRLAKRAESLDPSATLAAATASPDDVEAQCAAADVELLEGHSAEAFARLVGFVARSSGADRDRARLHLLSLFEVVGADDPTVGPARAALSRALF